MKVYKFISMLLPLLIHPIFSYGQSASSESSHDNETKISENIAFIEENFCPREKNQSLEQHGVYQGLVICRRQNHKTIYNIESLYAYPGKCKIITGDGTGMVYCYLGGDGFQRQIIINTATGQFWDAE